MKLPVILTTAHKGKTLEIDPNRETVTVFGLAGERLGTVPWGALIDSVLGSGQPPPPGDTRAQSRLSLLLRVRYSSPTGQRLESRASGIGGGGLFIESAAPLPIGTELALEFALPDQPSDWLLAKGTVAWACPKADQYTFFPGMGVRFTEVSPDVLQRVTELVNSVKRKG
jgi:uncharacterized protein (TIGR02266 family)